MGNALVAGEPLSEHAPRASLIDRRRAVIGSAEHRGSVLHGPKTAVDRDG